jgi:site-specific recombinase XerD
MEERRGLAGKTEAEGRVFWEWHEKYANNLDKRLRLIRRKSPELPPTLSLHMLRHTFASHMVMAGVDLRTVADILGHTTTKTTEIYSHLLPDHRAAAMERLGL